MVTLYKKYNFKIYGMERGESKSEYIIVNTNKPFQNGHTHINDFHLAKHIIDLACSYRVPNKKKKFVIESLIRISSESGYINRLKRCLNQH